MEYSTLESWQAMNENGLVYEIGSLMAQFGEIPDRRKARGKRYSLVTLLVLVFLAKLSGEDSPYAIAEWCQARRESLVELLRLPYRQLPSHHTFRRLLGEVLEVEAFERLMRIYGAQQQGRAGAGQLLALDGKRLRGTSVPGEASVASTLAVYAVETNQVVAQVPTQAIGGEIASAAQVLEQVEVRGKVILADALHTQRPFCQQLVDRHGDYLLTLKDNQHRLYREVEQLFAPNAANQNWLDVQTARAINKGHGRIEERRLQLVSLLPGELDWPGLAQAFQLERRFRFVRQGQVVREEHKTHFGLTSLPPNKANANAILAMKRQYWQIETGLHYRRDVTFREDATRMSRPQAAYNLSIIHNTILSLFARLGLRNAASARRRLAVDPSLPFSLLVSAHPRL